MENEANHDITQVNGYFLNHNAYEEYTTSQDTIAAQSTKFTHYILHNGHGEAMVNSNYKYP